MIVAAAIKIGSRCVCTLPKPARHFDIELAAAELVFMPKIPDPAMVKGFLTHEGEFLARKPAAFHAVDCGQVDPRIVNFSYGLTTENLW